MTGSSIAATLYGRQVAQRQLETAQRLLGQQTSPASAAALWQARDQLLVSGQLVGQTVTATILFAHIRNFSSIAEQHTANVLLAGLNEYLNATAAAVVDQGGLVNKFTGDGLMALFGAARTRQTWAAIAADAQSAVASALALGRALHAPNARWQVQQWPRVQVRVRIYTGPVAVGSLGGPQRLEYSIAARLQDCEKDRQPDDCRILIARETLHYLGDRFPVEWWGELPLKGRERSVDVFRVVPGDRAST